MRPGHFQLSLMLVVFTSRTRKCRSRLQFEMGSATGLEPEEVDTDHELFRTIASSDVQAADQDRDHDMESSSEDEDGDGRTYASDSEPDGACYDGFDDRSDIFLSADYDPGPSSRSPAGPVTCPVSSSDAEGSSSAPTSGSASASSDAERHSTFVCLPVGSPLWGPGLAPCDLPPLKGTSCL